MYSSIVSLLYYNNIFIIVLCGNIIAIIIITYYQVAEVLCCFILQNKNTHLNQAIHEEQEAILELRVQLRLLQSQKLQQEHMAPPTVEQATPAQPSPEERTRADEPIKRNASVSMTAPGDANVTASTSPANGKPGKDALKPSPSKTYAVNQNPSI